MSDQLNAMGSSDTSTAMDTQFMADRVRAIIAGDMEVESIEVPKDRRLGVLVLRGRLLRPSAALFTDWMRKLRQIGYIPVLRHDHAEDGQVGRLPSQLTRFPFATHSTADGLGPTNDTGRVALHVHAGSIPKSRSRVWINLVLFLVTLLSTLFVGSLYSDAASNIRSVSDIFLPQNLIRGWPFAATLLGVLGAHEFGHYFAARYHNVAVTLPYFIPMPLGFGTLGAFIQLKEPVPDRRRLFDIGVAGPLAGLVLALPLLLVGLATSPVRVPELSAGAMLEGNSILYYYAKLAVLGKVLPNPITGEDVLMNQVTFAAWIGLFVTALNLLPVGQLDGGHTVYALFGRYARVINIAAVALMAISAVAGLEVVQAQLPVLANFGFTGWFFWLFLIFVLIGPFHPPALDDVTELDAKRRIVGYVVIAIFLLTFVPVPFRPLM